MSIIDMLLCMLISGYLFLIIAELHIPVLELAIFCVFLVKTECRFEKEYHIPQIFSWAWSNLVKILENFFLVALEKLWEKAWSYSIQEHSYLLYFAWRTLIMLHP